jgi:hypothetical protein
MVFFGYRRQLPCPSQVPSVLQGVTGSFGDFSGQLECVG